MRLVPEEDPPLEEAERPSLLLDERDELPFDLVAIVSSLVRNLWIEEYFEVVFAVRRDCEEMVGKLNNKKGQRILLLWPFTHMKVPADLN